MAFLSPQLSTGKAPRLGLEPCPRAQDCPVSAQCLEMWNERLLVPEPCPESFSSPPCPKTCPSPPCPLPWLGQGEEKGRAQTRSSGRASLLLKQMLVCAAPGKFARGRRLSVNMQPPEKKEAQKKAASKKKQKKTLATKLLSHRWIFGRACAYQPRPQHPQTPSSLCREQH